MSEAEQQKLADLFSKLDRIKWRPEALDDFLSLDRTLQIDALTQLKKINSNPELGKELGKRRNMDLTGFRKLYFCKNRYRIVYIIKDKAPEIWAIGKRDKEAVYKMVSERIDKINK
ncbi:MAG: type II toxin-antitoxin system RelE/ParE family toxin [Armatimonadetes bacterium]|nr:type II toxin-antitoxin system RelE/ParE family toxin [Armatimonadota bacterium]